MESIKTIPKKYIRTFKFIVGLLIIFLIIQFNWYWNAVPLTDDDLRFLANEQKSLRFCKRIQDESIRDYCYSDMADRFQDYKLCEKHISDESTKDICIYENIVIKNDFFDLCDRINGNKLKYHCYIKYARENREISICEKINIETGKSSKDECYEQMSIKLKDSSLCEKISVKTGFASQDSCYYFVFLSTQDVTNCANILEKWQRNQCFKEARMNYNTTNLCLNITSDELKRGCEETVDELYNDGPKKGGGVKKTVS